jgi:hypothetical protein
VLRLLIRRYCNDTAGTEQSAGRHDVGRASSSCGNGRGAKLVFERALEHAEPYPAIDGGLLGRGVTRQAPYPVA